VLADKRLNLIHLDDTCRSDGFPELPAKPRMKEPDGSGVASVTERKNFLSVSISAHTRVVAGSMYPPKMSGVIGSHILAASTVTCISPAGAANAVIPYRIVAALATDAVTNFRWLIVMLFPLISRTDEAFPLPDINQTR
jgi:hypothetical protein